MHVNGMQIRDLWTSGSLNEFSRAHQHETMLNGQRSIKNVDLEHVRFSSLHLYAVEIDELVGCQLGNPI